MYERWTDRARKVMQLANNEGRGARELLIRPPREREPPSGDGPFGACRRNRNRGIVFGSRRRGLKTGTELSGTSRPPATAEPNPSRERIATGSPIPRKSLTGGTQDGLHRGPVSPDQSRQPSRSRQPKPSS
jgi:hypothetical protein